MSYRITNRDLQGQVDRINRSLKRELTPYSKKEDGTSYPNPGNFHLLSAYGGVSLHEMSHTPGCTGTHDVFSTGYMSKRELYDRMSSFLRGLEYCNE